MSVHDENGSARAPGTDKPSNAVPIAKIGEKSIPASGGFDLKSSTFLLKRQDPGCKRMFIGSYLHNQSNNAWLANGSGTPMLSQNISGRCGYMNESHVTCHKTHNCFRRVVLYQRA
jgi:hypothetical protein